MKQHLPDYPFDKDLAKMLERGVIIIREFMRYNANPWSMIQATIMLTSDILAAASLRNAYIECIDLKIQLAMHDIFDHESWHDLLPRTDPTHERK